MPGSAFAAARLRLVVFDEVTGETSYLDALHEIAHNAEPAAKRSRPLLEREANAWTWALSHSQIPLTIEGRRHIAVCLLTYMRGRRSNTRLPPSEHPFWRLAGLASPAESTRRAHGLQTTADEHARTAREALLTAIREDERGPRLAG